MINLQPLIKSNQVNILGVKVTGVTVIQLHSEIRRAVLNHTHEFFLHANIHGLNLAYQNNWLKAIFNSSSLVFCDGTGVVLAGSFFGYHFPPRITFADWTWQLAKFCAENNFSLFFLGAAPGIAQKAAERLQHKFKTLIITGTNDGFFDKTLGSYENNRVINTINLAKPDILIVGFGMPLQEKWLFENWDQIDAQVALTGGAVFDYVSGKTPRAPRWMTDHGLEWLGRLIIEPRRLWRRYLLGTPLFFFRIFLQLTGLKKYPVV